MEYLKLYIDKAGLKGSIYQLSYKNKVAFYRS